MIESLHSYMKVGIIHHMIFPECGNGEGPILETLQKIVLDDYFDAVECIHIKDTEVNNKSIAMIRRGHMELVYGAHPRQLSSGLNINDLDELLRLEAVIDMKQSIDYAYEMGASCFVFLAGKYEEKSKEHAFLQLVKSVNEMCDYAKSKGKMKIALETFDYDMDKKSLIGPAVLAKRLAETIYPMYDNFGLLVDSSHIPLIHESFEEHVLPIKDYIIHAHMGNTVMKDPSCEAYGDNHPRFGFPNSENDVIELAIYLRTLLDIGFLNKEKPPIVSFEIKPWGDENSEIVIANAKRTLNRAWAFV